MVNTCKYYDDFYNKLEDPIRWKKTWLKEILKVKNKKILDIGCGLGNKTYFLEKNNYLVGCDISLGCLKKAKEHNSLLAVNSDAEKLPFRNQVFDVVICSEVLEHLINPQNVINEIKRVAKKDARIILTVPNHFSLNNRINLLFGNGLEEKVGWNSKYFEYNTPHLRFFTWKGFNKFLDNHGLVVVNNHSYLEPSVPNISLRIFKINFLSIINKIVWLFVQNYLKYQHTSLFSVSFIVECKKA